MIGGFRDVGDRWRQHDLENSPAVWLPLHISDGVVSMPWVDEWSLEDVTAPVTA